MKLFILKLSFILFPSSIIISEEVSSSQSKITPPPTYNDILNSLLSHNHDEKIAEEIEGVDIKCNVFNSDSASISIQDYSPKSILSNFILYKKDHVNLHNQLLSILSINSFLNGNNTLKFDYDELSEDDSILLRKVDMLNHFKENYKSIQTKKVSMLYRQDSNFCLTKKYEDEILLICFNLGQSNQQIVLNILDESVKIGLSLLDRSMIRFENGIARINLASFQTKIYTIKR